MATAPAAPLSPPLPSRNWGWVAFRGVLLLALGLLAFAFPGFTLFAFALLFAAYCFVDGIASIASGIRGARHHRDRWWMLVVSGLLGIAVGVVFAIFPALGTLAYAAMMVGLIAGWAIVTGLLQVVGAWRLRREIKGEWLFLATGTLTLLLGLGLLVIFFIAPAPTLLSVAWFIGIWALASGIALLMLAFRLRRHAHG